MKRKIAVLVLCTWCATIVNRASGVELLTSGDFEIPAGADVPGWNLQEFVTGSGNVIDAAELAANSPIDGARVLWLKPFAGGQAPGPNNLTNVILSQTVDAVAGETYTFKGWSRWEANYPGGVTTLDGAGPLGAVDSPTDTTLELSFLDAGGSVIGAPSVLDLRNEQSNFNFWVEHMLSAVAPAGAAQVRVAATARDMVWNVGPVQSAFYDNFSLTTGSAPATQILANPSLEDPPASGLDAWDIVTDDPGNPDNDEIFRVRSFANHTPGGSNGVWISSFFGEPETPVSGTFSQTVSAMPGVEYTLTGWSRWETNYSGGLDTIGGNPSPTETLMELAFLDASEMVIGAPIVLDVKQDRRAQAPGANANDNLWYQHTLNGVAPAGTVSARVSGILIDGIDSDANPQSAFFDDFSLQAAGTGPGADLDGDGDVDGNDLLLIQRGLGTTTTAADFANWRNQFGSATAAVNAVPEPSTMVGALACATAVALHGRRRKVQ